MEKYVYLLDQYLSFNDAKSMNLVVQDTAIEVPSLVYLTDKQAMQWKNSWAILWSVKKEFGNSC